MSLLGDKFNKLQQNKRFDESFEFMKHSGGFKYQLDLTECRDSALDLLDEMHIDYSAVSPTIFEVDCHNRETAYSLGKKLSTMLSRTVEGKTNMKDNKRAKDALEKMQNMKPRNPIAALPVAGKAGAMDLKKDKKKDPYGRKNKYRPRYDESFKEGDQVEYMGETATVRIANGPENTLGLDIKGELKMVSESQVSLMEKAFLSTPTNLLRLRELAGVPQGSGPLDAGTFDVEIPGMDSVETVYEPDLEPITPSMTPQSDGMATINCALDSISDSLQDIKISEFKTLVAKLEDLLNRTKTLGYDYLGD